MNGSSSVRLPGGLTATAGVAYRDEDGRNTGSIAGLGPANYALARHTAGVVAETLLERKGWSAIAGLRSDWVSNGYQRSSPRLAATIALPWHTARARMSWGRGFKLPSFYAIAHPLIGNRDLRPETNDAIDAGFEQSLGRKFGVFSLNLYRSAYGNLVDFSPQLFRLVNRNAAVVHGIDLSWIARLGNLTVKPHATYSSARLEGATEQLRDRPRWRFGAVLTRSFASRASIYADVLGAGKRYDFQLPIPQQRQAPSYFVANAGSTYRFNDSFSAFLRVDNVTNQHYEENAGFPNPGLQMSAGMTYSRR